MKNKPTADNIALAVLEELRDDRMKFPDPLSAPSVDDVFARVERRFKAKPEEEAWRMGMNALYEGRCLCRWNLEDKSYILQISDDGMAVLASHKEKEEEERKTDWKRVSALVGLGALGVAVIRELYVMLASP